MDVGSERNLSSRALRVGRGVLIAALVAGIVAAVCYLLINGGASGSKKELGVAVFVAALPILLYAATARPLIFPFCLYVLLVPFDSLLAIDPRYGTVTKLVAICAVLAFAFSFIRTRRVIAPDRAVFIWLGLLIWMALSVYWAIDSQTAVTKLVTYAELIGLYVIVSVVPISLADFRVFAGAVVLGAIVSSVYAIHLFHSGVDVYSSEINHQFTSRVIVRGGGDARIDPNEFGAALMLPISFVLMLILQRKWSLSRLALIGILLILLGGVYVTASRGAEVSLAGLMAYLALRSRYRVKILSFSLVGLGAVLLFTNPFVRFGDALKTGGAGRLPIWMVGWEAFKQHWLAGAGVGNFPFAYDKSFIFVFQTTYSRWHRASHNTPLTVAVELGIIGLCIAIVALYGQWRMLASIPKSSWLYDLRVGFEGSIIALVIASLFLETLDGKFIWLAFELMAVTRALALYETGSHFVGSKLRLSGHEKTARPVPEILLKEPTNA